MGLHGPKSRISHVDSPNQSSVSPVETCQNPFGVLLKVALVFPTTWSNNSEIDHSLQVPLPDNDIEAPSQTETSIPALTLDGSATIVTVKEGNL